jgi:hypothetical protein
VPDEPDEDEVTGVTTPLLVLEVPAVIFNVEPSGPDVVFSTVVGAGGTSTDAMATGVIVVVTGLAIRLALGATVSTAAVARTEALVS